MDITLFVFAFKQYRSVASQLTFIKARRFLTDSPRIILLRFERTLAGTTQAYLQLQYYRALNR
jgi:hypothetical protein